MNSLRLIINEFVSKALELKLPDLTTYSCRLAGCSFCGSRSDIGNNTKQWCSNLIDRAPEWEYCPACETRAQEADILLNETNSRISGISETVAVMRSSGELQIGKWKCRGIIPWTCGDAESIGVIVSNEDEKKVKHPTLAELEEAASAAAAEASLGETLSSRKRKLPAETEFLTEQGGSSDIVTANSQNDTV